MCMCVGVKNHIVTCEKCFGVKKVIDEFWRQVAQKQSTGNARSCVTNQLMMAVCKIKVTWDELLFNVSCLQQKVN